MKVVVDNNTGEIIKELSDSDIILNRAVYKNLKDSKVIKYKDFITFNMLNLTKLYVLLSRTERDIFLGLLQFLEFGDNHISTGKGKLDKNIIALNVGYKIRTLNSVLRELHKKNCIYIADDDIYINPFIAVKGMRTKKSTIDYFRGTIFDE